MRLAVYHRLVESSIDPGCEQGQVHGSLQWPGT